MTTMKAMTYYGENDIRFEDRPKPTIIDPNRCHHQNDQNHHLWY
ncbi:hypothetical protein [Moraxella equi]|uniref:Uncharacterized protein n=1 Tax=Moraxella equi TaxID=60442 RepID=A0A378QTR2_9GAMM|nr:Uncharacterised protein [Moraxella equi]